jgi:hypothetical protein
MYETETLIKIQKLAEKGIEHIMKHAHPNPGDGRLLIHTFVSYDAEKTAQIFQEQLNIIKKVLNV